MARQDEDTLRPLGSIVQVANGRYRAVEGRIIGYTICGTRVGYVVRLQEGCDTASKLYLREVALNEEDLV